MAHPEPASRKRLLRVKLNGRWREDAVAENQLLVDYLRQVAGLTGTKIGCDGGECGALDIDALRQLESLVRKQVQPMRTTMASAHYRRLAAAALVRRLTAALAAGRGLP